MRTDQQLQFILYSLYLEVNMLRGLKVRSDTLFVMVHNCTVLHRPKDGCMVVSIYAYHLHYGLGAGHPLPVHVENV